MLPAVPLTLYVQLCAPVLAETIVPMIDAVPTLASPAPSEPDAEPTVFASIVSSRSVPVDWKPTMTAPPKPCPLLAPCPPVPPAAFSVKVLSARLIDPDELPAIAPPAPLPLSDPAPPSPPAVLSVNVLPVAVSELRLSLKIAPPRCCGRNARRSRSACRRWRSHHP